MIKLLRLLSLITLFTWANSAFAQLTFTAPDGTTTNAYTLSPAVCQGASVDHCINVSGGGGGPYSIIGHSGSLGTQLLISPPSNPQNRCFRYTAAFNFVGNNTITFTVQSSSGVTGTVQITIVVVNPNTPIDAGPNQTLCSPINFTTLTAVNPDPLAGGYWSVFTGPSVISGGFDSPHVAGVDQQGGSTVTVSNLQLGSNIFRWNQAYPCTPVAPFDLVTVYVYNGTPPVADANTCYPSVSNHATKNITLCGTTSYTLCANSPGTAATGTWNIFGGCGTIYNINNASADLTNLCAGCNSLEWSISNGTCPGGDTKDTVIICVYPTIQQAFAGTDLTRCLGSFTNIVLSGNTPTGANTGQWVYTGGPVASNLINIIGPNSASTNVTGLTQPGIYQFSWTITSGPCGSSTDEVLVYVYSPTAAINAGLDQNICLPNNSTTLAATLPTAPAQGSWSVVSGTGSFSPLNSPNATVNGLSVGENRFRWTVSNGNCSNNGNFDDVSIFVYPASQPVPNAGLDQSLSYSGTPVSTTLAANTATAPGTGTWTATGPSTPVFLPNTSSPTATVSNLIPGTYTLTWTLSNGPCAANTTDQMQILVYSCSNTSTNAGPTQNLCSPANSVTMNAQIAPVPAVGTWSIVQGGGSISGPNNPATTITNIPIGVNIYRWTINNGPCGTYSSDVTVNVFNNAATVSNAGADQSFCGTGSPIIVSMAANTPLPPATGAWTGPGTIVSVNSPTTNVTNLPVGLHTFIWTVSNGPCGTAIDTVLIRIFAPGQTNANAGLDQQLCSNNNNTTVIGNNLISPATGQWTVVMGGGTIASPNSQATGITNIPIGHNEYRWTINNGPCTTPPTLFDIVAIDVFSINQLPANAGQDQNVCSNQSTVTLTGNSTIIPAVGTWTVSPTGPLFLNNHDPNTTVSSLTPGTTYTFTWTINNGTCGTTADAMILNYYNNNHAAANAGNAQSICLPQNSVTLAGNLQDDPATGTWSLISGPNTPIFSPNQHNTTLSGLVAGTYVMRWTINNGSCAQAITFSDVIIQVFSNAQTPAAAGLDQEICDLTFTQLTGNALISPATGLWSQISGPNTAAINNPSLSQVNVSGLVVGCYTFRWTVNNGICGQPTMDDVMVCVFDDNQTIAAAGPDQNLCSPISNTTLAANAIISPAVGVWTIISAPNTPTFTPNANQPNATLGNLIVGTYVLQWSVDNGSCNNANTTDQVIIRVFNSNALAANAGPMQELCSPAHTVTMAANAAISPAVGTWSVVSGSGSNIIINDPTTQITNIPIGSNCFNWTIDNGGCGVGTTSSQVCVNIYSSNQAPANAGIDQDICTPQSSVTLSGNSITSPATGQWVQISGPSTATISSTTTAITDVSQLEVGCYEFQWSINNGVCANPNSSDIIEVCVYPGGFPAANAGVDQELCSPTASTVMNADPAIAPGEGTWTLVSGPNTPSFSINNPATTVSNLQVGVYVFDWSLNYSSCGSESDQVVITVYNSAQGAAVAGPDQAFCTPTSSTSLQAQAVLAPGYGTWSLVSGDVDFVDEHSPTTTAYNIPAGIHTLVWTVYNGDCLAEILTTDTIVITINDNAQLPATAGLDQSICTPQSSVQLQGTPLLYPSNGVWTTTSSATISPTTSANTTISNLEVGINTFCWTINNGACSPPTTSDCVDIYVYDHTQEAANAGEDQNICAIGNTCTVLSGNSVISPAIGTWNQIDGLTTVTFTNDHQNNTMVCGMQPGVYVFQWCINNGPCGPITCDQVTITVYPNNTPPASVGPDIELCTPQTTVSMNASIANLPGYGQWELISGSGTISNDDIDNPQAMISSLAVGENVFSWCVFNGVCPNSGSCDTLSIFLFDENALPANAGPDQDLCESSDNILMQATAVAIPGTGTWTALGPYASSIVDIHDPITELTGLGVGEYLYLWTVYNGPCATTNTTDIVRIRIYESSQPAAFAGQDIHICTPQNTVMMNANAAIFPATSQWNALPGGSGTIAPINSPTATVTNLLPGISTFSWTINNGPCVPSITTDSVSIYLYDTSISPAAAGENQYFCAPVDLSPIVASLTGSIIQGAATGLWTQVSGPSTATISTPTQNATDISGLLVGEYIFRWTVQNGPCGSTQDEVSIFINDPNLPAAEAGPDADYCTPVDAHQFAATPVAFPAFGTWSAFPPVPINPSDNDPNAIASNLSVGYQIFIWTVDNGACEGSSDLIQVRIYNEFQPNANAGADIELCLPQTEVNLSSTDIFDPAVGIWDALGCGTIDDVNSPNTLISALCLGTQCFRWTVDNGPCPNGITQDTVCVRVFDPEIVVSVSEDQSICTPESSVSVSGTEPQDPNTAYWSTVQGGGTPSLPQSATTEITNLPVGINIFRWQFYNGVCANQPYDEVTINVYDQSHPWANAGEDVELCFPITETTLTGNTPIIPAIGYWTLVCGSGNISDINSPTTQITGLEVGDNCFVWTIENGPCANGLMTDTVVVHVFPENPQSAMAGPDMEICTPESSVTLAATNPDAPSTGMWEIIMLNGEISSLIDANATLDFLTVGIHTLNWTIDNGPCNANNSDAVSIYVYDATLPPASAGEDIELCSPTDIVSMSANSAISPAIGFWSFGAVNGNPQITDPTSPTTSITQLAIGINELIWTIDNGDCGITSDTVLVTVFDPASPSSSVSDDEFLCDIPECVNLQGSAPTAPAYGWWTQIAGDNTADIADASSNTTTACGLALNESAFVWHVYNGACNNSNTTDTVWFYIYDSQISAANAGKDAVYCDPDEISHLLEGSELVGTVQGLATGEWTGTAGTIVNPNSSTTQVENIPAGFHCFTWTVDNGACGISSDEVCITVYDQNQTPAFAGSDLEICSNEFLPFYLNGNEPLPPATGQWTVIDGPAILQGTESHDAFVTSLGVIITELVDVNSTMVWTINNGLCGLTSDTVVYTLVDCETLKIPDAFSPNGDGTNDVFYIPNLEHYPNNRLQIFNRWGSLVYVGAPYKNDWDGRSTHSATIGQELPVSTYYYVLNLGETYDEIPDKVFTGFVYLKR